MKTLSLTVLVVAAVLVAPMAGAQGVTVNGKPPKNVKVVKVKETKAVKTVTAGKKHRKKFLGIF